MGLAHTYASRSQHTAQRGRRLAAACYQQGGAGCAVLQDAAKAARERAAGAADQQFLEDAAGGAVADAPAHEDAAVQADAAEAQYHAELRAELQVLNQSRLCSN